MSRLYLLVPLVSLSASLGRADEVELSDVDPFQQFVSSIEMPSKALELLAALPKDLSPEQLTTVRNLDRMLAVSDHAQDRRLADKILGLLARSGAAKSLAYLHEVFESAPGRRAAVAGAIADFTLSHRRRAEDWRLLVRSLPVVEDETARRVLRALMKFPQRGTKAQWQRQVILAGLRLDEEERGHAVRLLEHWGAPRPTTNKSDLASWQARFDENYPDLPPPTLPVDAENSNHKYEALVRFLESKARLGDAISGATIYEKTQCANCHRIAGEGEALGPDLTTVGGRLSDKQMLQSLLFPSHEIPEEYQTRTVITVDGRTLAGVIRADGNHVVVLPADGKKVTLAKDLVEEIRPSRLSAMPEGLLNDLSKEEIADLLAYLRSPGGNN